ncbi:MAG: co-chaperone DjlA [Planctomycetes bacterium]|nr:co-chaperone DjlA [Planctomycetota bacterium]
MGLFGSIFGGAVGFALGGPIGAMLGAMMGGRASNAAAQAQQVGGYSARDLQTAFTIALVSLAAKVAKADGRVCENEVSAFDDFLKTNLRLPKDERQNAGRVFNLARDNDVPAIEYAKQLHQIFRGDRNRLLDVITILLMIALADGELHPQEENVIGQIARAMGLNARDVENCKATFNATRGTATTSATDAYKVLGVNKGASDAEVKSAHRKLVREYHPDVLASKGLPEDFVEYAQKKMVAINDAWDVVKNARGL